MGEDGDGAAPHIAVFKTMSHSTIIRSRYGLCQHTLRSACLDPPCGQPAQRYNTLRSSACLDLPPAYGRSSRDGPPTYSTVSLPRAIFFGYSRYNIPLRSAGSDTAPH